MHGRRIDARAATGPKHLIISKVLGPLSAMEKKVRKVLILTSITENLNSGSGGAKMQKEIRGNAIFAT